MSTIRELFEEAVQNDYSYTAHSLYYLLREGLVSPNDSQTILNHVQVDTHLVGEWTQQNYLCISVEKVYALKLTDDEFVFVFAKNPKQAVDFIQKSWKVSPRNCCEYSLDFSIMRGIEFVSFREIKKDYLTFPAVIGVYKRE
ncbi:hypothetical protein [Niallia endozanthoxylica]|uniref:Uncharacterized protein n=1 Tax=Niallia endozanthoxylica TaxID=2036016 RepID=A0A5J5HPW9_9BACI|nr:hypothetical protein [Niallia endozanthoxylica]KAA9022025.1 hypothetical protein F4V44_15995 [Niallia endozanthoxylica]